MLRVAPIEPVDGEALMPLVPLSTDSVSKLCSPATCREADEAEHGSTATSAHSAPTVEHIPAVESNASCSRAIVAELQDENRRLRSELDRVRQSDESACRQQQEDRIRVQCKLKELEVEVRNHWQDRVSKLEEEVATLKAALGVTQMEAGIRASQGRRPVMKKRAVAATMPPKAASTSSLGCVVSGGSATRSATGIGKRPGVPRSVPAATPVSPGAMLACSVRWSGPGTGDPEPWTGGSSVRKVSPHTSEAPPGHNSNTELRAGILRRTSTKEGVSFRMEPLNNRLESLGPSLATNIPPRPPSPMESGPQIVQALTPLLNVARSCSSSQLPSPPTSPRAQRPPKTKVPRQVAHQDVLTVQPTATGAQAQHTAHQQDPASPVARVATACTGATIGSMTSREKRAKPSLTPPRSGVRLRSRSVPIGLSTSEAERLLMEDSQPISFFEAFGGFYKQLVQGTRCTGPDALAVNERFVEIDLSAEFPPERREAQIDLLAPEVGPLGLFEVGRGGFTLADRGHNTPAFHSVHHL